MKDKKELLNSGEGIYDARALGLPRMFLLGAQHMFAMFGATVLVPALTGLSVAATLFFAGVGTLLFHALTKGKVPAFLGSSFAFLAGYWAIAPNGEPNLLPYACFGVMVAGGIYLILAGLIRALGSERVLRFFPPVVTGPTIIAIGLCLSGSAVQNCADNVPIALIAIAVVIAASLWGRGMMRIIPILLGVASSYIVAALTGGVDFTPVREAAWLGLPLNMNGSVFSLFGGADASLLISAVITMLPLALAAVIEHVGDIYAISSTCRRDFVKDPGLHRTLLGDGLATMLAAAFGAPANTTYGENTGVLALTKVYDPWVIRLAAIFAVILSFSPKFAALISVMPAATIGGVSLVLYGMISAVGIRNLIENKVDFTRSKNILITALILVLAIGISYSDAGALVVRLGGMAISLSGLAVASVVGVALGALLPDR